MTPPTIEQRVQAQDRARREFFLAWGTSDSALLTADELRRVLTENEELNAQVVKLDQVIIQEAKGAAEMERQRDQWRDLCSTFAHLRRHGDYGGSWSALERFDALVKEEKP